MRDCKKKEPKSNLTVQLRLLVVHHRNEGTQTGAFFVAMVREKIGLEPGDAVATGAHARRRAAFAGETTASRGIFGEAENSVSTVLFRIARVFTTADIVDRNVGFFVAF